MAISSTDLALLSARLGVARLGASRLGFIPYDVEGALGDEPGEYVWHEIVPPEPNDWTLVCDSWICVQSQKVAFAEEEPAAAVTGTVTVTSNTIGGPYSVSLYVDGELWDTADLTVNGPGDIVTFSDVPVGDVYATGNINGYDSTSTTETLAEGQTVALTLLGGGG